MPIFVSSLEQAWRDAVLALELGADVVEYRVDLFDEVEGVAVLVAKSPARCVVTCRAADEGGRGEAGDERRVAAIQSAAAAGAAYVDFELASLKRVALGELGETRLILSSHDFVGRPERLYNILAEMSFSPGEIGKIVWTARSVRDNVEAFEILQGRTKPMIALCMGEAGIISRILAKKFGAFLTFASLNQGAETAPGQVSIGDMKRLYRWDAIGARTKVFGVVGSPVGHSMSPAIHNAAFAEIGFDAVYVPLLVNEGYESFKAFMETFLAFGAMDLGGLSITIPHKENALRYLKEKGAAVDALAESIGAVNTIVVKGSGFRVQGSGGEDGGITGERGNSGLSSQDSGLNLRGFSSDYSAILDSITFALGVSREALRGYRVAVIGAGGTGRTAVAALAGCGATVVVYNRTFERAAALAREFDGKSGKVVAARMEKLCDSCCTIFINTTSVGMHPNVDASPVDGLGVTFGAETLVFDAIYNPMETKLIRQAREAGAKTVGGVEMFVRQAAGQFEAWTGKNAPVELMRRVVEARLG